MLTSQTNTTAAPLNSPRPPRGGFQPGIVYNWLAYRHAPHVQREGHTITTRPALHSHACAIARTFPGATVRRAPPGEGWIVTIPIKTIT